MVDKALAGRTVAITGGARGIGLATAKSLIASGANVVIGDIDEQALSVAAAELGDAARTAKLDVSDSTTFAAFLDFAAQVFGSLDVLVNNAGIMPIGPFVSESEATARRTLEINVLGAINGTKLAIGAFGPKGKGHIVNVASVAGKSPVVGGITYAASKAAIVSLTESARVEYAKSGIDFTCVMPSFTATELIAGTKGTKFVPTVSPEDVAAAIVNAIASPRYDVFIPAAVGLILRSQSLLGRKLRDTIQHAIGADSTFLDVDHSARAAYERRISNS